ELFRSRLFDVVPSVVLTSATLSTAEAAKHGEAPGAAPSRPAPRAVSPRVWTGGDEPPEAPELPDEPPEASEPSLPKLTGPFRFQRQRLGLDAGLYAVDELRVPSPFRFEQRALLYLPKDLPMPDDP